MGDKTCIDCEYYEKATPPMFYCTVSGERIASTITDIHNCQKWKSRQLLLYKCVRCKERFTADEIIRDSFTPEGTSIVTIRFFCNPCKAKHDEDILITERLLVRVW